jgi:NADP-dependent aldehyde dehydrogenase
MKSTPGFQSFNPIKNKFNDKTFFCSNEQEIEYALENAQEVSLIFSNLHKQKRAEFLVEIKSNLLLEKDSIWEIYHSESGLSESRFAQEFERTINQIQLFADFLINDFQEISSTQKEDSTLNTPSLIKKWIGIGPVLVLGSSNFPLAYSTIGGDTVSALAAGCPVIVKAHPMHVGTSSRVAHCILKAIEKFNFPKGVFSHLIDDSHQVATKLVQDNRIKAVGFTGGIRGGRALMDLAHSRPNPIPVFAEMGSTNPAVIFKSDIQKNIDEWTSNLAQSICKDAGQFCTKPGVILVPNNSDGEKFSDLLTHKIRNHKSYWMLHPNILKNFEFLKIRRKEKSKGLLLEKSGQLDQMQGRQAILKTTIFKLISCQELNEEVFGPFSIIATYNDLTEISNYINSIHGQLTFTFLGSKSEIENNQNLVQLASEKAGRIIFNGVPTGVIVSKAMNHSGPYPASSDSRFSAVGTDSLFRFLKSVTYQNIFG